MRDAVWVATLSISTRTRNKIENLHGITEDDVRQAIIGRVGLDYRWDKHPERGWRVLITCEIRFRRVVVVHCPAPHPMGDAWRLGSAYFID